MLIGNPNNKPHPRTGAVVGSRNFPKLSFNLHTMPQTSGSHFKKWLFLGVLILGLMVLIVLLLFWQ